MGHASHAQPVNPSGSDYTLIQSLTLVARLPEVRFPSVSARKVVT